MDRQFQGIVMVIVVPIVEKLYVVNYVVVKITVDRVLKMILDKLRALIIVKNMSVQNPAGEERVGREENAARKIEEHVKKEVGH
jgi:hypothetical protein